MFQTSFHLPHIRSVHVGEKRWQDSRKNSKKKKKSFLLFVELLVINRLNQIHVGRVPLIPHRFNCYTEKEKVPIMNDSSTRIKLCVYTDEIHMDTHTHTRGKKMKVTGPDGPVGPSGACSIPTHTHKKRESYIQ